MSFDSVLSAAMHLPTEQRYDLVDRLLGDGWDEDALSDAMREEVQLRIADDRTGKTQRVAGEVALKTVRETVLGR